MVLLVYQGLSGCTMYSGGMPVVLLVLAGNLDGSDHQSAEIHYSNEKHWKISEIFTLFKSSTGENEMKMSR